MMWGKEMLEYCERVYEEQSQYNQLARFVESLK